jgi:hypothetical protein
MGTKGSHEKATGGNLAIDVDGVWNESVIGRHMLAKWVVVNIR